MTNAETIELLKQLIAHAPITIKEYSTMLEINLGDIDETQIEKFFTDFANLRIAYAVKMVDAFQNSLPKDKQPA